MYSLSFTEGLIDVDPISLTDLSISKSFFFSIPLFLILLQLMPFWLLPQTGKLDLIFKNNTSE